MIDCPEGNASGCVTLEQSPESAPLMAWRIIAVSKTDLQIGPTLSNDQHNAMTPVLGTRPKVGRSPVAPHRMQGDTIEPYVSEPRVKGNSPAAVAEALPALDPEDPSVISNGFLHVPPYQMSP